MKKPFAIPVLILASAVPSFLAQEPKPPEPTGTVIRSDVREVMVDFVVRSKGGQMVKKLKPSDVTVLEDGVRQTVKTFRFIGGDETGVNQRPALASPQAPVNAAAPTRGNTPDTKKVEDPTYVSVVFEDLSPNTRKYARDAVVEFINHNLGPNTYIAVFTSGTQLTRVQNFTKDPSLVAAAANTASTGETSVLAQALTDPLNQFNYSLGSGTFGITVTPTVDPFSTTAMSTAGASSAGPEGTLTAMAVSQQVPLIMYHQGMTTVDGLLRLVQFESQLPGRKAVIYLCEGLSLPPGMRDRIDGVISAANRANVSFYGIDVTGLTSGNPNSFALITGRSVAAASARQMNWEHTGADESMAKQDDNTLLLGTANLQQNMQELSERTGGFAVMNTNEIGKNMLRVVEDLRTHYEITYVPASQVYDGHFRKIEVRLPNPKWTVQSRDGYYALPDLKGQPIEGFELAALKALSLNSHSTQFPFHLAALRFRPEPAGFGYEIAFDVPIADLSVKVDPAGKLARIHATFVALIKDSTGEVVDKVSRDIDRMEPADMLERFRRGDVIATLPVSLPPGRYTVEGVSTDPESNRSSVRRIAVVVPHPGQIALSDLALVHDLETLSDARDPANGLEFDGGRITPELGGITPAAQRTALYFVVYPGSESAEVRSRVQFLRDGVLVAEVQPAASRPDSSNATPFIASAKLSPGDYEARVTVECGGRAVVRSTAFTVVP